ncbi:hypothetical protein FGF1_32310 [Flavobacteriaceae bacterium GF1]
MAKKSKNKRTSTWSTDRVLSISAFFISVISLIALLYQSYLAREENKLMQKQHSATVMPYLSQWFDDSPGKHNMVIGNDGIGPALLKKVTISTKNDQHFNRTDDFFRHISKSNTFLDTTHYLYSTVAEGILIPANSTTEFASFDNSPDFKRFLNLLHEIEFHFEIEYEDVYGSRWSLKYDEDIPTKIKD